MFRDDARQFLSVRQEEAYGEYMDGCARAARRGFPLKPAPGSRCSIVELGALASFLGRDLAVDLRSAADALPRKPRKVAKAERDATLVGRGDEAA